MKSTPIGLLAGTAALVLGLFAAVGSLPITPTIAQNLFVTNTPFGSAQPLTSSTPAAPLPTADSTQPIVGADTLPAGLAPDAPIENYALRIWLEADMLTVMEQQIASLDAGGIDARLALQLTSYELTARFPGAPTDPARREQLIRAALAAPRGAVDMRFLVLPYINAELNRRPADNTSFEYAGFRIDVTAARVNADETRDALVHILYPAAADDEAEVLFEMYLLALGDTAGALRFLPAAFDLPAAPFGSIRSVSLQRLADVNEDTLDEMVLLADDGAANQQLLVVGLRGGSQVDLAAGGQAIRLGELLRWEETPDSSIPVLRVNEYGVESAVPNWDCLSEQVVEWQYINNFYRRVQVAGAARQLQATLGCALYAAEPLFAQAPDRSAALIEQAIVEYTLDSPSGDRALLTLAMMYVLIGRRDEALAAAQAALPAGETDSWAARQAGALVAALNNPASTPLDICEALGLASFEPACDIDRLLGRYLGLANLRTDTPLAEQLEGQGFKVAESVIVTEVGKAAREVISFDYHGSGWWGFAAQRDGTFVVEKAAPPREFAPAEAPQTLLQPPAAAITALLVENRPQTTLDLLESLIQNNPDTPLAPSAQYLRALSSDLAADRRAALRRYYNLWNSFPQSLWGQLAAQHLERR